MMRGMNMSAMMKQVKQMQKKMKQDQETLNATVFTGHAPEDLVVVKFTGDRKMTDLTIKPEAVDPDDVEMLQDLLVADINDAMGQIDSQTQKTMGKYAQNIPGL